MTVTRSENSINKTLVLGVGVPLGAVSLGLVIWLGIADDLPLSAGAPRIVLFAGVFALPIVLAAYAARVGRPNLLSRVGTMAVGAALIAGPAAYPLGIAGVLWIIAASRAGKNYQIDSPTVVVAGLWAVAIVVALFHEDPLCVETSDYTVCTDNLVVWWETAVSLVIASLAVAIAVTWPEKRFDRSLQNQTTQTS